MLRKTKDRIRNYFIAGLLTVVPLSITVYVISILLTNAHRNFNIIPNRYNPNVLLPFPLPGLGAIVLLGMIFIIGLLVKNDVGSRIIDFGERLVYQIPLVRPIYSAVKQLQAAVFSQSYEGFKRVIMIEYPGKGIDAFGSVTGMMVEHAFQLIISGGLAVPELSIKRGRPERNMTPVLQLYPEMIVAKAPDASTTRERSKRQEMR